MKIILLFLSIISSINADQISLKGKITDRTTGEPLSFANVRIYGTTTGTAANLEGNFELKLKPGSYIVITSFIGYKSDTLNIQLNDNKTILVKLEPIPVRLPEVTVLPGVNPDRKSVV